MKFVTDSYSDSEDILKVIADEKCIALTYRTAKNFLKADQIHYRFIVKQKSKDGDAPKTSAAAASPSSNPNEQRPSRSIPILNKPFKSSQKK